MTFESWFNESDTPDAFLTSIGRRALDPQYVESVLGVPMHLYFVTAAQRRERGDELATDARLESITFYSLCKGLFLPLSSMNPNRAAQLFGVQTAEPPDTAGRRALVESFIAKDVGLSFSQKIACLLGDPFYGNRGGFRRDSLIRIMQRTGMWTRKEILDKLAAVGDIAVLFADSRADLKGDPPLTAAEVFETLRLISGRGGMADRLSASTDDDDDKAEAAGPGRTIQLQILTSLLERCGKVEAYFLAKLLLRKAGFGFEYDGGAICDYIAKEFGADPALVNHAVALTDTFHIIRLLQTDGPDGLRKVTLKPLVPVRPALANGTTDEVKHYPVWVERKYDGIRFTLHKATDSSGSVLCGAYTRNRLDWLEMVPGLDRTIKMIQAANVIVDGELYGTVFDLDGVRPANVYEVYAALHGQPTVPVTFAICGVRSALHRRARCDVGLPLHERRRMLQDGAGVGHTVPDADCRDGSRGPACEQQGRAQPSLPPLPRAGLRGHSRKGSERAVPAWSTRSELVKAQAGGDSRSRLAGRDSGGDDEGEYGSVRFLRDRREGGGRQLCRCRRCRGCRSGAGSGDPAGDLSRRQPLHRGRGDRAEVGVGRTSGA